MFRMKKRKQKTELTESRIREITREEIEIILEQRAQEQMQSALETMKAIKRAQSHHVCENNRRTEKTKPQQFDEGSD